MKKIIAFLMAMMLMLGCCAFAETEEEIHIGICAPATSHGWVGGVAYFAKLAADETSVKYEYVTCTDNADMADKMLASTASSFGRRLPRVWKRLLSRFWTQASFCTTSTPSSASPIPSRSTLICPTS